MPLLKPIAFIYLLFLFNTSFGQYRTITGVVKVPEKKVAVANVVIYLLSPKDSGIYAFTRPLEDGSFKIEKIDTGNYILLISALGYEDHTTTIRLNSLSAPVAEAGIINLNPKSTVLKEVSVLKKVSIVRMKGDTTEFYVDSLKLQPNASVEDLLKHLPGMEVDKNGRITAQGQTVQKVLVDGNEFFGEDPTLATRNLYASMIEKVQLYDAQTKQAAFSGIDDGLKKTTLDLKLKKEYKTGYFGKLDAGYGSDKFYQEQAMFNDFHGNRKFAVYGIAGNNNIIGLNPDDYDTYAGSANLPSNDELDSWNGKYEGQGIPTVRSGGLHYDNRSDNGSKSMNSNYKIYSINIAGESDITSRRNLPGNFINSSSKQQFNNTSLKNEIISKFELQPNPASSIEITLNGSVNKKDLYSRYSSQSARQDSSLLNSGMRNFNSSGNNDNFNGNFLWLQKLKKAGRSLSLGMAIDNYKSSYTGALTANNKFYNSSGLLDSTQNIDQAKITQNSAFVLDSKVTYTEPLQKGLSILADYSIRMDNSDALRKSFTQSATGKYDELDSMNSNRNKVDQLTQRFGVGINYKLKNIILTGNVDFGVTHFTQEDVFAMTSLSRSFSSWYPNAKLKYQFNKQSTISIAYNGYNNFPSPEQLNPVHINDDPLNVFTGNTNLSPSFSHNFNLLYRKYSMIYNTTVLLNSSYSFTDDPITINIQTDSSGKNTYQYQNADKSSISNYSAYFLFSKRFSGKNITMSLDGGVNRNMQLGFTNGIKGVTKITSYSAGIGLSRFSEKKYDFSINGKVNYNINDLSFQKGPQTNYWSSKAMLNIEVYVLKEYQIHSESEYNFQQPFGAFSKSFSQCISNIWIGRRILASRNLLIKGSVNDIFNQNSGFIRYAGNNVERQNNFTTIKRYFLFSVVFNFIKSGSKK